MILLDIQSEFISEIQTVNDYIAQVCNLFYDMCESRDGLIKILPRLYSAIKNKSISNDYSAIRNELHDHIGDTNIQLTRIQSETMDTEMDINPDDPTADGDLLLFLCAEVKKGEKNRASLFRQAKGVLEALCITRGPLIHGERFYELDENDDEVYHLVDIALKNEQEMIRIRLERDINVSKNIQKSIELFNLDNLLNIYRQSFIQVMSYFDTCIFSLIDQCMKRDFFFWLSKFENSSLKTHDIAKYTSFDEFRDEQIRAMLKKCYVKDLLYIIRGIDSNIFVINGNDAYAEIQELIGRRNTHVHNKGIVDYAYFDKFNIYHYDLGTYLCIDEDYFKRTQYLAKEVVNAIVSRFQ